jgi:hypothetical protein
MNTHFQPVTPDNFTRTTLDIYGNPRYICHLFDLLTTNERNSYGLTNYTQLYALACKRANKLGGRKYTAKRYGGGIVFQSYNIADTCERINKLLSELN